MTKQSWAGFAICALLGAASTLAILIFGTPALAATAVVIGLVVVRSPLRGSWYGLIAGAGVIAMVVAYLQRYGPGTSCWFDHATQACDEYTDPIPWIVGGIVLVALAVILQIRRFRRSTRREPSPQ